MPDYPPTHAGTTAHPKERRTEDLPSGRTEDPAALVAQDDSAGTFLRRVRFDTPREGRNPIGAGVVKFNKDHGTDVPHDTEDGRPEADRSKVGTEAKLYEPVEDGARTVTADDTSATSDKPKSQSKSERKDA